MSHDSFLVDIDRTSYEIFLTLFFQNAVIRSTQSMHHCRCGLGTGEKAQERRSAPDLFGEELRHYVPSMANSMLFRFLFRVECHFVFWFSPITGRVLLQTHIEAKPAMYMRRPNMAEVTNMELWKSPM